METRFLGQRIKVSRSCSRSEEHTTERTLAMEAILEHAEIRQHPAPQPVPFPIVLPHGDEVLRAENQGFKILFVFGHPGERGCHQRLAKADNVTYKDTAAPSHVPRGELNGGDLKSEELGPKGLRYAKLNEALTGVLAEVVGDLDVDVIRRHLGLSCPALVDDAGELAGDVEAPDVIPALFEPGGQFATRIAIHYVDIQLSLFLQAGPREIAAAEVTDLGIDGVGAEEQV